MSDIVNAIRALRPDVPNPWSMTLRWLLKAADEIERLRAELAEAKREYREGGQSRPVREWENLFGSAPNATGSLSSEAFVRKQRDDDWP